MPVLPATIANNVLEALAPAAASAALAITGPLRCRLMTAAGTAAAAGTELATGGGYTAGGAGMGNVAWNAAASQQKTNSAALSVTNMPACSLVGPELWDSAATPVRVFGGTTATFTGQPIAVAAGNTFTLPASTGLVLGDT